MNRDLLDPQARTYLEELEATVNAEAVKSKSIAEKREDTDQLFEQLGQGPEVESVVDRTIPGPAGDLAVRILRGSGAGPDRPLIVFFHGGGYYMGSLKTIDVVCRGLANACRATVLAVEYRLAPESPFPSAFYDCLAATHWAATHATELGADPETVVVAGDSAGGNFAMAVAAAQPQLCAAQLLIYPHVTFAREHELFDASLDGLLVSRDMLDYHRELYVPKGTDLTDPRVSPLEAESVGDLPPAVIVVAQCDPLRPQGEAVHARLREAGVQSELLAYSGMVHGFYGLTHNFEKAQHALDDTATALEAAVAARRGSPA